MKTVTVNGGCTKHNRGIGYQFKSNSNPHTGEQELFISGSFIVNDCTGMVSGGELTGKFMYGQAYGGCRACGNKYVYQCCHCMSFNCYDGNEHRDLECPVCHKSSDVPKTPSNAPESRIVRSSASSGNAKIDIILTIDISGSMTCKNGSVMRIDEVKAAACSQFIDKYKSMPNVRMAVVTFGSSVDTALDFTADKDRVKSVVTGLRTTGWTECPFNHIISRFPSFIAGGDAKRFIVVFTDGAWDGNEIDNIDKANVIKSKGISIITIGCAGANSSFLDKVATPGANITVSDGAIGGGFAEAVKITGQG